MAVAPNIAIGVIETRGLVALTAGVEAMCKTADVACIDVTKVGMGYLAATVEGTVAAVRQALEAGEAAVAAHGELRGSRLFPKPSDRARDIVDGEHRQLLAADPPALEGDGA